MEATQLFSIASTVVLPGWILLILAPRYKVGRDLVAGMAIPLGLGLMYLGVFAMHFGDNPEGAGFGSLEAVRVLFSSEWSVLVGWVHYLAFDLFIGAWEVRDAQRLGISHLLVIPCLLLTFMLGPIGLVIYLLLRGVWKGKWSANEAAAEPTDSL